MIFRQILMFVLNLVIKLAFARLNGIIAVCQKTNKISHLLSMPQQTENKSASSAKTMLHSGKT